MNTSKTDTAEYLFHRGTNLHAYEYFGCHRIEDLEGRARYRFRLWAPHATEVLLISDFTAPEGEGLCRMEGDGVYELILSSDASLDGRRYRYKIRQRDGETVKGDPYAFASEGGAEGWSLVCDPSDFSWRDAAYIERRPRACREEGRGLSFPLNIYEMHLGSFARQGDGRPFSYRETAALLIPYIKYMGYTHVELMPIAEYPYDGSLGYGSCALYAPTARYGTPNDLRFFVDALHRAGIGVILDFVPTHFPKDRWGLCSFDGEPLYEYREPGRRESDSWGTHYFDLGREEVQSFLISAALFWLREYHMDGLRIGELSTVLYGESEGALHGLLPSGAPRERCVEAIGFLRRLNAAVHAEFPGVLTMAECKACMAGMTADVEAGGLGFDLAWDSETVEDLFLYLGHDPIFRRHHHAALVRHMDAAYRERRMLPLSHDAQIFGRGSLYSKISGDRTERLRILRTLFLYLMTVPGKKLTFMGCEFGQEREWQYREALDWDALKESDRQALRSYVSALNAFYAAHAALWEQDHLPCGFSWVACDRADEDLVAYQRHASDGETLIAVLSFNGADIPNCRLTCPESGEYTVLFRSDERLPDGRLCTQEDTEGNVLHFRMPAASGMILARAEKGIRLKIGEGEGIL